MKKKVLSLLLSCALILSLLPVTVLAVEEPAEEPGVPLTDLTPAEPTETETSIGDLSILTVETDYSSESAITQAKETYGQANNDNFWYIGADKTVDSVYAYLTIEGNDIYSLSVVGNGAINKSSSKAIKDEQNKVIGYHTGLPFGAQHYDKITAITVNNGVTEILSPSKRSFSSSKALL